MIDIMEEKSKLVHKIKKDSITNVNFDDVYKKEYSELTDDERRIIRREMFEYFEDYPREDTSILGMIKTLFPEAERKGDYDIVIDENSNIVLSQDPEDGCYTFVIERCSYDDGDIYTKRIGDSFSFEIVDFAERLRALRVLI